MLYYELLKSKLPLCSHNIVIFLNIFFMKQRFVATGEIRCLFAQKRHILLPFAATFLHITPLNLKDLLVALK